MHSVKDYIPHREPFLFVDEILDLSTESVTTQLTLREDFSFFQGHYPGNPIMPGVIMCESVFQTAAIYMTHLARSEGKPEGEGTPLLSRIKGARFKRMAKPGDVLTITVKPSGQEGGFAFMNGKVTNADGQLVVGVDFVITQK